MSSDWASLMGMFVGTLTSIEVLAVGIVGPMLTRKKWIIPLTAVLCIFAHGLMIGHWYSAPLSFLAGLVVATISYFTIGKWTLSKPKPETE